MQATMSATAALATPFVGKAGRMQKASSFTGSACAVKAQKVTFGQSTRSVQIVASASSADASRRSIMLGTAAASLVATTPLASLAAIPSGFNPVQDLQDNYEFLYPFGWQEVGVDGEVDVVYKDVIEPLESVSVSIIPTQTEDLSALGSPEEVGQQLVEKVLSTPSAKAKLVGAKKRETKDKTYYTIEYVSVSRSFTRHGLSTICINDGKFYQLTTGSNEKRWDKMSKKLNIVAQSFQLIN